MKYKATHTTYINKMGVQVPSTTTILQILNKPFLQKWANIMGFKGKRVEDILNDSAKVGSMVHHCIESYLMGRRMVWTSPPNYISKVLILSHLGNFIEWKKKHEVSPIFMEQKCVSEQFGGTVDFYGMVDGKYTILDFKTSKKPYSSMFLQLAAYVIMLEEMGHTVEQVGIIIVRSDGHNEKFLEREKLQPYIDCFKMLVSFFHGWYDLNVDDGWGDILA